MGNCLKSAESSVNRGKHVPFNTRAFNGESPSSSGDTHPTPSDSAAASVRSSELRGGHTNGLIIQNGSLQSSNFFNNGKASATIIAVNGNGVNVPFVGGGGSGGRKPACTWFTALYDFNQRADEEVSFKTGDILEAKANSREEKGFVYVFNPRTGMSGWAPVNYLAEDTRQPTSQIYYFNVNRRKAEIMLMRPNLFTGTFILRPCADQSGNYFALSVRNVDERAMPEVKHYKVRMMDNNYGCYISPKRTFEDIRRLVDFYSTNNIPGMCRLTQSFPHNPPQVPLRDLNVPKDQIQLIDRLGQGNFGEVWKGQWKTLAVAVKMIKSTNNSSSPSSPSSEDMLITGDGLLAEAVTMSALFHDNLVKIIAVCIDEPPFWIVTELMNRGSLLDLLRSTEGRQQLKFTGMIDCLYQVSCGMEYLERMKFLHRDLRAANVLVNMDHPSAYEIKIADFGLARLLEEDVYEPNGRGTRFPIKWTAPEAALYRRFSTKSDVWSFGVLTYEIVTYGKTPYPGKSAQEVIDFVERGGRIARDECRSDDPPMQCPEHLYRIMLTCWHREPDKRPTFEFLRTIFENYFESTESQYREAPT